VSERLASIGPVNYVAYGHVEGRGPVPGIGRYSSEVTDVRASARECRLDWHAREVRDALVAYDGTRSVALKDVRQIAAGPMDAIFRDADRKAGRPAATYSVDPATFGLRVTQKSAADIVIVVQDPNLMTDLVRALARASEACGGGPQSY